MIRRGGDTSNVLLGNLSGRVNLRGYDGVERNPIGGATISTGNYGLIAQTTDKHFAIPLSSTPVADALTPANAVVLVDDAGIISGAGTYHRIYAADGVDYVQLTSDVDGGLAVGGSGANAGIITSAGMLLGGALLFTPDATHSIGATGASRPLHYWGAGNITLQGTASALRLTGLSAASTLAASAKVSTDTQARFNLYADGKLEWGAGGVSAADTILYRSGISALQTNGSLAVDTTLDVTGISTFRARLQFTADNTHDIGVAGARPRTLIVGTSIVVPTIGPASGQQHTLPAVASDTFGLLAATQTFTNKTLTNPTIAAGALSGTFSGDHTYSGQVTFNNATAPIIVAKIGPSSTQQHSLPVVASDTVVLLAATQTLTNKTLTTPIIATILTSAGLATLTLPSTTDTLVGRLTTDTMSNKTLTSPNIATPTMTGTWGAPAIDPPTVTGQVTAESQCSGYCNVTYAAGVPTLQGSYNVTSITDTGLGQLTVTWNRDFASTNYTVVATAGSSGIGARHVTVDSKLTGSTALAIWDAAGALADPASVEVVAFGILA